MDQHKPLFEQIAEQIEQSIIDGSLAAGDKAPSTNELAAFYGINPATAAKGINLLVERGILFKQRGIGMFVASGAYEELLKARRAAFAENYLKPLLSEADRLGISITEITKLAAAITQEGNQNEHGH